MRTVKLWATLAMVCGIGLLFWAHQRHTNDIPIRPELVLEPGDAVELGPDSLYVDSAGVAVPSTVNDRHRDHVRRR